MSPRACSQEATRDAVDLGTLGLSQRMELPSGSVHSSKFLPKTQSGFQIQNLLRSALLLMPYYRGGTNLVRGKLVSVAGPAQESRAAALPVVMLGGPGLPASTVRGTNTGGTMRVISMAVALAVGLGGTGIGR
jgi:hypothetical protein